MHFLLDIQEAAGVEADDDFFMGSSGLSEESGDQGFTTGGPQQLGSSPGAAKVCRQPSQKDHQVWAFQAAS